MSSALRRSVSVLVRPLARSKQSSGRSQQQSSTPDVKGLSVKVVEVPSEPVGPGASKSSEYKNPEYFSYNNMSYFEAEVEMLKFRLPQPSSKKN